MLSHAEFEHFKEMIQKPIKKDRICLKCLKVFRSQERGQRICLTCKQNKTKYGQLFEEFKI